MTKKICLETLKILLTPKEMKNVLGGTGGSCNVTCSNGKEPSETVNSCYENADPCGPGVPWNCCCCGK